jgi:hypothetical protein
MEFLLPSTILAIANVELSQNQVWFLDLYNVELTRNLSLEYQVITGLQSTSSMLRWSPLS